jgi:RimJ/RimL family protein N-acetyltransferase
MSHPRVRRLCTTRDGQKFVIREAAITDAEQLMAHTRGILSEPQWSVTESEEFQVTTQQEEDWIAGFRQRPHSILLVAGMGTRQDSRVIGAVTFNTQPRFRVRHRGRVGIGVQAAYRGLGVGEALLQALLDWAAAEPDIERVELSVFAHNEGAIRLYRKLGFAEEARLPRAFKLADGSYYDEIMMVKWVKQS